MTVAVHNSITLNEHLDAFIASTMQEQCVQGQFVQSSRRTEYKNVFRLSVLSKRCDQATQLAVELWPGSIPGETPGLEVLDAPVFYSFHGSW